MFERCEVWASSLQRRTCAASRAFTDDFRNKDHLPAAVFSGSFPSPLRNVLWVFAGRKWNSAAFSSSLCCSLLPVPLWRLQSFPLRDIYVPVTHPGFTGSCPWSRSINHGRAHEACRLPDSLLCWSSVFMSNTHSDTLKWCNTLKTQLFSELFVYFITQKQLFLLTCSQSLFSRPLNG